jgi:glucosylceramidase
MKHYFHSGVCAYMYWNFSAAHGGMSTWGWAQNALVAVDAEARTFRYTHDYYLLKHLSHFVDVGAKRVDATGTCDDALAFVNPDGSTVIVARNELPHAQMVQVAAQNRTVQIELPAASFGTLVMRAG